MPVNVIKGGPHHLPPIAALEKRLFPKNESLHTTFEAELKKRTSCLLVAVWFPPMYAEESVCSHSIRNKTVKGEKLVTFGPALAPERVVGYLLLSNNSSKSKLLKLAVAADLQRQGIGTKLLCASFALLRESHTPLVALHVDVCRSSAVSLYRKFGFFQVSFVKDYYEPGRDAMLMHKRLDDRGDSDCFDAASHARRTL
mmetsp:Transcript_5589/g.9662  ORF Transcript_5589/g.9662 Transcript_5589/m.9662 type:complete len:199 (+) Transcript_5589:133-729(+)